MLVNVPYMEHLGMVVFYIFVGCTLWAATQLLLTSYNLQVIDHFQLPSKTIFWLGSVAI